MTKELSTTSLTDTPAPAEAEAAGPRKASVAAKEISPFIQAMSAGHFVVTARCHLTDDLADRASIVQALARDSLVKQVTGVRTFGNEVALECDSAEAMVKLLNLKIPNKGKAEGKHVIGFRPHKGKTAVIYHVHKTSMATGADVTSALKVNFPHDSFRLFQHTLHGVGMDDWAVRFEKPPSSFTKSISFPGTGFGGKVAWSSAVTAIEHLCDFCKVDHGANLGECTALVPKGSVEATPPQIGLNI